MTNLEWLNSQKWGVAGGLDGSMTVHIGGVEYRKFPDCFTLWDWMREKLG